MTARGNAGRRPRGVWLPPGGCFRRGCAPHSLFVLDKKRMRRARWKRKNRFWSQLCTCVQSCCTGVGVRGCLRVCEDWTTGAAGRGADLVVDSRGAVHLGSGGKDAFDSFLFPRVPLRYALPGSSRERERQRKEEQLNATTTPMKSAVLARDGSHRNRRRA